MKILRERRVDAYGAKDVRLTAQWREPLGWSYLSPRITTSICFRWLCSGRETVASATNLAIIERKSSVEQLWVRDHSTAALERAQWRQDSLAIFKLNYAGLHDDISANEGL